MSGKIETTEELVDPAAVQRVREHSIDVATTARLAAIFRALADPTRVSMLHALLHGELCVGDLSTLLGMTELAVSHQLRLLRDLQIVRARRVGRLIYYALDDDHVTHLFQLSLDHVGHTHA